MPDRLPMGRDTIEQLKAKTARTAEQLAPWRENSLATAISE
jgi:hypothetical protein